MDKVATIQLEKTADISTRLMLHTFAHNSISWSTKSGFICHQTQTRRTEKQDANIKQRKKQTIQLDLDSGGI